MKNLQFLLFCLPDQPGLGRVVRAPTFFHPFLSYIQWDCPLEPAFFVIKSVDKVNLWVVEARSLLVRNGIRDQNLGSWCTHCPWGWRGLFLGLLSRQSRVWGSACIYIYFHTYVHSHTKMHDHIHLYTYAHIHVHIHTLVHTYPHFGNHESTLVLIIPAHTHGVAQLSVSSSSVRTLAS